jgi:hypothetical protein
MFSSECVSFSLLADIGTEIFKSPPVNEFDELRYFVHKACPTECVCCWPVRIVFILHFHLLSTQRFCQWAVCTVPKNRCHEGSWNSLREQMLEVMRITV